MSDTLDRDRWSSFGAVLRDRAEERPEGQAFAFLSDGEHEEARFTYGELEQRTRALGALLLETAAPGDRALLLYPPGTEYVVALFACLRAGIVAVPAYPPDPARLNRTLPRLLGMVHDAQASLVLTLDAIRSMAGSIFEQAPDLARLTWVATDAQRPAGTFVEPDLGKDTLALLQYTSGSTTDPRGVMLTHGNLLQNSAFIHRAFGHSRQSQGVIWLPPYHDMGLIGGVLQPVFGGFPVTLMSPLSFLQRPLCWLKAIAKYRATTSGGPNFAYDLCVRRVRPEQIEGLDLSSWDLAFNGAEPIRRTTLDAFVKAFQGIGFRREAFYPCYGLAEGTLAVSGGAKEAAPILKSFSTEAIERRVALPAEPEAAGARWLVGSGQADAGHTITIVDPDTLAESPASTIGEIWVTGPSVARGYWNQPEATEKAFGARLSGGRGPFLRTGDLGFLADGELFVTGRLKDVLIVQGRNYYPQDIEIAVEQSHAELRRNCGAAFTVDEGGRDLLVVVQEVETTRPVDHEEVVQAIRRGVAAAVDLQVHTVVLIRPRSLPKTSSGKVQRWLCREQLAKRELDEIHRFSLGGPG